MRVTRTQANIGIGGIACLSSHAIYQGMYLTTKSATLICARMLDELCARSVKRTLRVARATSDEAVEAYPLIGHAAGVIYGKT